MKKNTSDKFTKRLAQYSALGVAIAAVSSASGQIIYTDIDPDEGGAGIDYFLDLDGDFINDYHMDNAANGANALRVNNDQGNSILVMNAGGNYNYPFTLDSGAPISSGATDWLTHSVYQTLNWNSCSYTNSQWCGVTDKYLGLRFNIGGNTHYGWARLDVGLNPANWLIKDYAYNSVPDEMIAAGDTGVLGTADQAFSDFSYYVDTNSMLNLKASAALENVALYSVSGQRLLGQELSNTQEAIDISSLSTGIYFAAVTIDGNTRTFKFIRK